MEVLRWATTCQIPSPKGLIGILACLPRPPSPRDRFQADAAADRRSDDAQLGHQPVELHREHRLGSVAQGLVGIVVHLDNQTIRTDRDRRSGELRDHVAAAGAMVQPETVIDPDSLVDAYRDGYARFAAELARRGYLP